MSAPVGSGLYESLHITVIQDMNILNIIGDAVTEMIYKSSKKNGQEFWSTHYDCGVI